MKWLISMKEIWERMIFVNNSKGSKDQHGSFFGDSSRRQLTCHRCGQEGHVRHDCPRKSGVLCIKMILPGSVPVNLVRICGRCLMSLGGSSC